MKFLNYLPVYLNDSNELKDEFTSGDIKLKMSIRYNGEDAEYWTNIDCTVYADYKNWIKGDLVFIKYNEMREVFGAYGESNRIINYDDKRIALINPNFRISSEKSISSKLFFSEKTVTLSLVKK